MSTIETSEFKTKIDEFHALYDEKIDQVISGLTDIYMIGVNTDLSRDLNELRNKISAEHPTPISGYIGEAGLRGRYVPQYKDGDEFIGYIQRAYIPQIQHLMREMIEDDVDGGRDGLFDAYRILTEELIPAWAKIPEGKKVSYLQDLSIDLAQHVALEENQSDRHTSEEEQTLSAKFREALAASRQRSAEAKRTV